MNRYLRIAGVLCAAVLSSCEKNGVQDITVPAPASRIRFFNFGLSAPSVNFYANDTKMTAILSATGAEAVTGVAQGGVGSGGFYEGIAPGTYTLTGRISAATDKDLVISTVSAPIADGKWYSYYISGPYDAATKKAEAFVVEDPVPARDFTVAYVRFVNAISNSSPMVLSAKHQTTLAVTPIGAAISYKGAGAFTAIPSGVYDISARATDASTDLVVRTGVSFSAGTVYTIGARGDATISSTGTSANRPILDNTANR
ncbi:MAG TPA: DUF4397 domain-containing protein [Gemmatimonadaceae bacterium]|nr:DUF4397 domain-containing protein [Gemmatimonadaceae bacterium]